MVGYALAGLGFSVQTRGPIMRMLANFWLEPFTVETRLD